jgi:acyl-CoA reductase-like NAD-dependent aldehyde dehydrogenase
MKLGGKSAAVVLEDAGLEHAVEAALAKTCQDSGQTCTALTRLVGPAGRLAEAEKIAADVTASCRPGDPLAPEADRIPIGGLMGTAQRQGQWRSAGGSRAGWHRRGFRWPACARRG